MTTYTQKASGYNTAIFDVLNPFVPNTAGTGAPGALNEVEDVVAIARTGMGTSGNFWRLCRFPTKAKVKRLELYTDISTGAIDGGGASSALVFAVGVVFSDSTIDNTPVPYQNQMPTTVGIGGGTTTAGTTVAIGGTSANAIFGSWTAPSGGVFGLQTGGAALAGNLWGLEATFGGGTTYLNTLIGPSTTLNTTTLALWQVPLISIFNLQDGKGNIIKDAGYFDIIVTTTTVYNTQPAAGWNLYARLQYVV